MSEYPFDAEWEQRQNEPMLNIGVDWTQRSPYAFDRLPELKTEEETTERIFKTSESVIQR